MELYIQKEKVFDNGVNSFPTSASYFIVDVTKSWVINQWENYYVYIVSGSGAGRLLKIYSNLETYLYFSNPSSPTDIPDFFPDETTVYQIIDFQYKRVEMFNDEKVSVTSTIQNYSDIGKLFTDYSQSFTIPASPINNAIFSHWYESEVDNGYDARIRYNAYIEIDTVRFKEGNVQLEKANKKNNYIESYTLTFYGNLTQLKDKFGDDKLNSLDYSSLNHTYNSTEVRNRVQLSNAYDVRYPLIGNAYKYEYQTGSSKDITTIAGAIKWDELFPAITLQNIFNRIQTKYGINFIGSFFNLDQWKYLHLYLKPSLAMNYMSEHLNFNFTTKSASFPELNLTTDILTSNFNFPSPIPSGQSVYGRTFKVSMTITPQSGFTNILYTLYVYKNGILFKTLTGVNTQTFTCDQISDNDANRNEQNKYTFKISSNATFSFIGTLTYLKIYFDSNSSSYQGSTLTGTTSVQSTVANIQIANYIPDIKIVDFITGIIKAFNLMVIPKPNNTYEFIPLEMYYNAGKITDITEYIYSDEISIDKTKLFKTINFTYEESNNILNNAYRGLYQQNYGDLIYKSPSVNETSTYDIKLPFENVLFEVPTQGKEFQTATLIDKDLQPYIPKPMLIYCNGLVRTLTGTDRIYVTNSSGAATQITNYQRFSNEYDSLPTDATHSHLMTMNFGNEQSSWLNVLAPQGLYFRHYKNYIDNLYDVKTRVLKVKALLPASLLASNVIDSSGNTLGIDLNDRLVIRDKRYIINSFTTDLTTKEASFELITDYRGVNAVNSVGYRFASFQNFQTDKEELILDIEIYLNDYEKFNIKSSADFLVYTDTSNNKTDVTLTVTVPANTTGLDRIGIIILEYKKNGVTANTENIIVLQTGI